MRAQAHHGGKGGGETTHDIGMIETLEHSHPIPFFRTAFSTTSCVTSPGAVRAEGFRVAAKESGVVGRELGVAVEVWMGRLLAAQRGFTDPMGRAMSRAAI